MITPFDRMKLAVEGDEQVIKEAEAASSEEGGKLAKPSENIKPKPKEIKEGRDWIGKHERRQAEHDDLFAGKLGPDAETEDQKAA